MVLTGVAPAFRRVSQVPGRARLKAGATGKKQEFRQENRMIDIIATDRAPKAIGPYSQAVRANGFLFVSGQIAIDPKTQQVVAGNASVQTERVLENLKAIVEAAGTNLEHVVKTTVYLADFEDYSAMNEVYSRYFEQNRPARSTVETPRLPRNVRIEIDLIALL
jgi:2-iminobutanoate/2-iminopropanoate deaminase